ncbi:MAG: DUF2752 domain-containing protein [Bacteroidales bacterium]|nr:DUF2752 domain-containing protein [Bacteroidales bacterium]
MKFNKNNILLVALFAIFVAGGIYFYAKYDPETSGVRFPKCGFYVLTGYKCPGCGTQRALHHLLHGDIIGAVKQNFLVFLAAPFILLVTLAKKNSRFSEKFPRIAAAFTGYRSTLIAVVAIFVFWITRNIFGF